jgi:hypothetical protein
MREAFDRIRQLGAKKEYKEGFHQFTQFVNAALKSFGEEEMQEAQAVRGVIYHLIYLLATDTFEGKDEDREALLDALKENPEWNAEYERIQKEVDRFLPSDRPIEVEVLKGDQVLGASPITKKLPPIGHITPGRYTVRLSNGRVLWEGYLEKEDVIWAFAFPEKDLPMAAETETHVQEPTKTLSLLDGELIMHIYAGLESGTMRLMREKDT